MRNYVPLLVVTWIFIIGIWLTHKDQPAISGRMPVPTEFDINKSKRKDFKNQRKEYMKSMHRAHPDVDWEKMDANTRKLRTDKARQIRNSLLTDDNWNPQNKRTEIISRDLSGYWQERGSNNLAGRILTADIDWENNLIYCASDGGNIWRGSLAGEDWVSLTDYLQIRGIHFLRLIEFDDT